MRSTDQFLSFAAAKCDVLGASARARSTAVIGVGWLARARAATRESKRIVVSTEAQSQPVGGERT